MERGGLAVNGEAGRLRTDDRLYIDWRIFRQRARSGSLKRTILTVLTCRGCRAAKVRILSSINLAARSIGTSPTPVPSAGKTIERALRTSAPSKTRRVARCKQ